MYVCKHIQFTVLGRMTTSKLLTVVIYFLFPETLPCILTDSSEDFNKQINLTQMMTVSNVTVLLNNMKNSSAHTVPICELDVAVNNKQYFLTSSYISCDSSMLY